MKKFLLSVALFCGVLMFGTQGYADSYGFNQITSNGNAFVAGQLSVDVTKPVSGQVLFTIKNTGSIASSIDAIYFDDGTTTGTLFSGIASVFNGSGVSFSQFSVNPSNLPAGNTVGFFTTTGFSADADNPSPRWGVNPGESVGISFNLNSGKTYADTLAALIQATGDGGLRIGLHVISIGGQGSESFVNTPPPTQTPEPSILILLGMGLIGIAGIRRK